VGSELALPPEVDHAEVHQPARDGDQVPFLPNVGLQMFVITEVHQPARDGDQASALISFSAKTCSDNCLS
jgi:hypothetical protein